MTNKITTLTRDAVHDDINITLDVETIKQEMINHNNASINFKKYDTIATGQALFADEDNPFTLTQENINDLVKFMRDTKLNDFGKETRPWRNYISGVEFLPKLAVMDESSKIELRRKWEAKNSKKRLNSRALFALYEGRGQTSEPTNLALIKAAYEDYKNSELTPAKARDIFVKEIEGILG